MDHRIHVLAHLPQLRGIADVTLDHRQIGVVQRQGILAEIHDVKDGHLVAVFEKLRHQKVAYIAGSAGNKYVLKQVGLVCLS